MQRPVGPGPQGCEKQRGDDNPGAGGSSESCEPRLSSASGCAGAHMLGQGAFLRRHVEHNQCYIITPRLNKESCALPARIGAGERRVKYRLRRVRANRPWTGEGDSVIPCRTGQALRQRPETYSLLRPLNDGAVAAGPKHRMDTCKFSFATTMSIRRSRL